MRTHAAQRTMSRRAAAGSRRNKKYKHVGVQFSDTMQGLINSRHELGGYAPGSMAAQLDFRMQPNHAARRRSIEGVMPKLEGW